MADAKKSEAEGKANPVPVQPSPLEPTTNNPAIKSQTEQPASSKESDQASPLEGIPVWTIIWAVLVLVVFGVLWGTGRIAAIKKHLHETREQLSKATWPTREELKQHIVVVMLSSLLLAAFTVVADQIVREIIWGALLGDPSTTLGSMIQ